MSIKQIKDKIRGASMVEFALGAGVFFTIIFGMISLSIALSSKIILIRAADYVSSEAISNTALRLDTHIPLSCNSDCVAQYQDAITRVTTKGVNLIRSSWLMNSILKFTKDGTGSLPAIEIAVVRPGETWRSVNPYPGTNLIYSGNNGIYKPSIYTNCEVTPGVTKYENIFKDCPIHVEARARIKIWPFGSFTISGLSARYIETYESREDIGQGPAIAPRWSTHTFTPVPTATSPGITPTNTATATMTASHTPTTAVTYCADAFGSQAQANANCPPTDCLPRSNCVTQCYYNNGLPSGRYECIGGCCGSG